MESAGVLPAWWAVVNSMPEQLHTHSWVEHSTQLLTFLHLSCVTLLQQVCYIPCHHRCNSYIYQCCSLRLFKDKIGSLHTNCCSFYKVFDSAFQDRRRDPRTNALVVETQAFPKNNWSHIDASLSRQPLVKGERLVRFEVNAVIAAVSTWRSFDNRLLHQVVMEVCGLLKVGFLVTHLKIVCVTPKGVLQPGEVLAWCNTWRPLSKLIRTPPR